MTVFTKVQEKLGKCIKMNCWMKIGEKFATSAADAEKKI